MNIGYLVAFVLFVAGLFCGFGWFVDQSAAHAAGLVGGGLAVQLLGAVPVPGPLARRQPNG